MVNSFAFLETAFLDTAFSALSDPSRRAILASLSGSERTVGELARPLPMSRPAVSKHLRVLEGAGLVTRRREGRTHHVRLVGGALAPAEEWIARHRAFWEARFDALDEYLRDSNGEEKKALPSPRRRVRRSVSHARSPRRRKVPGRGRTRRR
jgi:DNA-binding transcriptional ArsR family regulator